MTDDRCFPDRSGFPGRSKMPDSGTISEALREQQLTEKSERDEESQEQNLVSGLFSALENDADLRAVVERWERLSVDLRQAIVKMVL